MKSSRCPDADRIVRAGHGDLTADEMRAVDHHIAGCAECREEVAALKSAGPVEAWGPARGEAGDMPEALWRAVSAARAAARPAFHVRIGAALREAGQGALDAALGLAAGAADASGDLWLGGASASVRIQPLAPAAVRGGSGAGAASPERVRAIAADHDMLFRRGANRLTVLITRGGSPAEGRRLRMRGAAGEHEAVTDSGGTAVFRNLPDGDYSLDVEGVEP